MAAPRATQFIALRNLSRGSAQVRHLHMTGPATYASPVLTKERPALNLPRDVAGLRAECKRRKIDATGSKQDVCAPRSVQALAMQTTDQHIQQLLSRLNADELAHSRAFSTAAEQAKRPSIVRSDAPKATRHFNTSRSLKAVNDSSTIDFAFFPNTELDSPEEVFRVPILPNNYTNTASTLAAEPEETVVMKPQISTMSADAVFLPMSDLSDGHGLNIDFHAMADRVAANLRSMKVPVEEQASVAKQIWNDMVDDILGLNKKVAA